MRKMAREEKKEAPQEVKFVDYQNTVFDSGSSATFMDPSPEQTLSGITQGDGPSERIGRSVALVSLHVRGQLIYSPQASTQTVPSVRVSCVLDAQTNGSRAQLTDIFSTSVNPFTSFQNLSYESRFTILRDREFVLSPRASATSTEPMDAVVNFRFNISLDHLPVTLFTGASDLVGAMTNNSIHLVLLPSTGRVGYTYTSRLRYIG